MPALTVSQSFDLASQHYRAGHWADAERLCRDILSVQPEHGETWHLLGILALQSGRTDLSLDSLRRATALKPADPAAHSDLGEACRVGRRLDEAAASLRHALDLQPDFAAAHFNLGNVLHERGQFDEAIRAFRRAIELHLDLPEVYNNLGNAFKAQHRLDEAIAAYRRALEIRSHFPAAQNNLGVALAAQRRFGEATAAYRQALALQPHYPEALVNLGNALAEQGQCDEAIEAYRHALALQPASATAHYNLGRVLQDCGRFDESVTAYREAIRLDPAFAAAHNNLSEPLTELGRFNEAAAACHEALRLQSDFARARFNLAMLALRSGDLAHGWPLLEARWKAFDREQRSFSQPRYDGAPGDGRRVLIYTEQGAGDSIHFIRYAESIAARGDKVLVECQPSLVALFRTARGVNDVVAVGDALPAFDLQVPLLSLPLVFHTMPGTIPHDVPYLLSDPARQAAWRARLGNDRSRLRVGLAWAGNPRNVWLRKRDIALRQLLPLWLVDGVDFFRLQIDSAQGGVIPGDLALLDHTADIRDFSDTAALMMELDLIITVDTAVAHLAGALGRPVWTLLSFVSDWRWGLSGQGTPWYPAMRLFRQPALAQWEPVVLAVARELDRVAREKAAPSSSR